MASRGSNATSDHSFAADVAYNCVAFAYVCALLCRPRGTLYPQQLPITSPTRGGRSVGIVRSRTQTMEFSLVLGDSIIALFVDRLWHAYTAKITYSKINWQSLGNINRFMVWNIFGLVKLFVTFFLYSFNMNIEVSYFASLLHVLPEERGNSQCKLRP
jgi:hypothetical protein